MDDVRKSILFKFFSFQIFFRFSFSIVVPFFSLILLGSGWTEQQITYFFAIGAFVIFLTSPIIGRISDEIGKRKIILFGLVLQMLFFFIYFFISENIILMYIGRVFEIIGFICVAGVSISAFEGLISQRRGFWRGLLLSISTIGTLLGPILAGLLSQKFEIKVLLLVASFISFTALVIFFLLPKDEIKKKRIKFNDFNPLSEINLFLKKRRLKGMAILGILVNSKVEIFTIFFPILFVKYLGFEEYYLGFLLAIPVFMHFFQFYFGKISDSISAEFGVLVGVLTSSIAIFMLPYIQTMPFLIITLVIYGLGISIWNVNAWSLMGEIARREHIEGEVVGTYMSLAKLGVFVSTLVSATLISFFGIAETLQLFAILVLLSSIIVYFLFKPIFHHEKHGSYFKHLIHK